MDKGLETTHRHVASLFGGVLPDGNTVLGTATLAKALLAVTPLIEQVLVYFAVAKKGEAPIDGKTDLNPEGLTAAWGLHAEAVAERLKSNGLSCSTPDRPQFVKAMLEKLIWIRYPGSHRSFQDTCRSTHNVWFIPWR